MSKLYTSKEHLEMVNAEWKEHLAEHNLSDYKNDPLKFLEVMLPDAELTSWQRCFMEELVKSYRVPSRLMGTPPRTLGKAEQKRQMLECMEQMKKEKETGDEA